MNRQNLRRRFAPLLCLAIFACSNDSTSPVDPGPGPSPDPGEDPSPPENVSPTISPIPDQVVLRNTANRRTLDLDFEIIDPDDDTVRIEIRSDDESVVAGQTLACSPGTCAVTLEPSPERSAAVTVHVTATDGSGAEVTAEFRLDVSPRLVTNADDAGPGSLRAVVAEAEPGDVIAFDTAGVFAAAQTIELQEQILLDKVMTIEGPGADRLALSGGGLVRVIRAKDGADVVIRGVTITKGRAPVELFGVDPIVASFQLGGGVLLDIGAKITLSECVIEDNVAEGGQVTAYGGGIANFHGTLVVNEGTVIRSNTAPAGGGLANLNMGFREARTRLEDAVVAGNDATDVGGGIYNEIGIVIIEASVIRENTAPSGGGIWNDGTLTIEAGSVVANNEATSGTGGGIATTAAATIVGSTVESNAAATSGGGISNRKPDNGSATVTLTESTVKSNTAGTNGGGIHSTGTASLSESTVESNTAAESGGGIMNDGVLTLDRSEVLLNKANGKDDGRQTRGGGGILNANSAKITSTTIEGNEVVAYGAGIRNGGTLEISEGSTVHANKAGATGGGVYNAGSGVAIIQGVTLDGNLAKRGAGIANHGDISVRDSHIFQNNADEKGGGYFQSRGSDSDDSPSVIDNTTIEQNSANFGGGVANGAGRITIQNNSVIAENIGQFGGGIDSRPIIKGLDKPATVIADTRIEGNIAIDNGGGAFNEKGSTLILKAGTRVSGNSVTAQIAGFGGGIYSLGALENSGEVSDNQPDDIATGPR